MNKLHLLFIILLFSTSCKDSLLENTYDTSLSIPKEITSNNENKKILNLINNFKSPLLNTRSSNNTFDDIIIQNIEKRVYTSSTHRDLRKSLATTDSMPVYYVDFVRNGQNGFTILTTDDRIPNILGYSENGSISDTIFNKEFAYIASLIPDYCQQVLDSMRVNLDNGHSLQGQTRAGNMDYLRPGDILSGSYQEHRSIDQYKNAILTIQTPRWIYQVQEKKNLLKTKWDQRPPYNSQCPIIAPCNTNAFAGCGAIAMAQICAYHQKPNGYDWSRLTDNERIPTDDAFLINEVGRLIVTIGNAIHTTYNCGSGSSSNLPDIRNGFINYGYVCSDIQQEVEGVLSNNEIDASRPVLICGRSGADVGHVWVKSGYKTFSTKDTLAILKRNVSQFNTYNPAEIPEHIWAEMKLANRDNTYTYNNGNYKYPYYNFGWGGIDDGYWNANMIEHNQFMKMLTIRK